MTRDKDRKRIIRDRMKKTGESYTTARAHVIPKKTRHAQPPPRPVDYAALAGTRDAVIAAKTGRTWREWTQVLDAENAAAMPHRDIAAIVYGKHGIPGWWAQAVTVGYERIKGLREIGQRRSGDYEATKSRTFNVPVNALFEAWINDTARRRWLDGVDSVVRTATAPKGMRLRWPDGTIVAVWFTAKGETKSVVALAHTKLRSKAAAEEAKKYWTARLDALASVLAGSFA